MKRIAAIILAVLIIASCGATAAAVNTVGVGLYSAQSNGFIENSVTAVSLTFNGNTLETDVPAFLSGSRTMVPIRVISETMGASVGWNQETRQASIETAGLSIVLTIGSATALVNGVETPLPDGVSADLASVLGITRTMVPLRFVSETLGAEVYWDQASHTADIVTETVEIPRDDVEQSFEASAGEYSEAEVTEYVPQAGDEYLATVTGIYFNTTNQKVVVEMDRATERYMMNLDGRIVIDLPGSVLKGDLSGNIVTGNKTVYRVRYSQYDQDYAGYSRVVRVVLDVYGGAEWPRDVSIVETATGLEAVINQDKAATTVNEIPVVVLDAGHGGTESGAVYFGVLEKHPALEITQKLYTLLSAYSVQLYMTRDSDTYVDLYERAEMANALNADVFVSIHLNSAPLNESVTGVETYYHADNAAGAELARLIHKSVLETAGADDRKVRTAGFVVIRKTMMASVLVETGFMSNQAELSLLTDEYYQWLLAEGICRGVLDYLGVEY